jgi:hypothetical protein
MNYCDKCDYKTDDIRNYYKHIKTLKHLKKVGNNTKTVMIHSCDKCGRSFSRSDSLYRHNITFHAENNIATDNTAEIRDIIKEYEHKLELEKKNNIIERLEEKIIFEKNRFEEKIILEKKLHEEEIKVAKITEKLENEKKLNSILMETHENDQFVIKSSMNALNFVRANFQNAPPIHYYPQADKLFIMGKYEKGQVIIYYFKRKELVPYIGEQLLKEYKKKNPYEQSVWSSDVVRKNMIVNEKINNKTKWTKDKAGIHVASYLIDPIIKIIKESVEPFSTFTEENLEDAERYTLSNKIIKQIENGTLRNEIIAYISPRIYLDKENLNICNIEEIKNDNKIEFKNDKDKKSKKEEIKIDKKRKISKKKIDIDKKDSNVSKKTNSKSTKKNKVYDKNGVTISSEYETPVDSDDLLESIIGRKLNKEKIYGPNGKTK